jgi:hypothetical protein
MERCRSKIRFAAQLIEILRVKPPGGKRVQKDGKA